MGSKLFVGGLAWGTTDDGLRAAFSEYGDIREAKVIMDRETGQSRGFGFVTFDIEVDAQAALKGLDGSDLDGRKIRVNPAEEKPRTNSSGGGYGHQGRR